MIRANTEMRAFFAGFPGKLCVGDPSETFKVPPMVLTACPPRLTVSLMSKFPFFFSVIENISPPPPPAVTKALQDCDVRGVGAV
jgi:hypothetical protein